MSEELEVLKGVTQSLNNSNIEYMITGSTAMNYYVLPRMTRDIDIVIEIQNNDITTLVNLFKDDFYVDQDSIELAVNNHGMFNIIHNTYVIKIDFIVRKLSEYRQTEFQRKRQIKIANVQMWIVSPEDLILSKLVWSKESLSALQFADIKNLSGLTGSIDNIYLNKWLEKLGLQDTFMKVLNE